LLRYTYVVTQGYLFEIVDPYPFANPAEISDFEPPGIFDVHMGFDNHPFAYSGTKKPEEPAFNGGKGA
jgi:hypothetical protein